jgi:restriction system protein
VAVQAKCYASSISNDAVQEAHTGKAFHDCEACAVVTNSTLTRGATELASKIGCRVIDGQTLPDLIRGQIVL